MSPINRNVKSIIPSSCPPLPSKGSHFFKCVGKCAEVTATCLVQFATMLQNMDVTTIQFYFERSDFQNWLRNSIGHEAMSELMARVKKGLAGENLRQELLKAVNSCTVELKKLG